MLSIFTTTKDFIGQNEVNQLNAIQSWTKAPYPVEIIIFGKSIGIEKIESLPGVRIIEDFEKTDSGVPYINSMFHIAGKLSKYSICCFVNADILLSEKFFNDIQTIDQSLLNKNYLIVGERVDVDVPELIDFRNISWETSFTSKYESKFALHGPSGSDFFAFPKAQYNLTNMPPLLVGRAGWDLWMIYNGRRRGIKVIDLSNSVMPIHLNHDYNHRSKKDDLKKLEDEINYTYLPSDQKYIYTNYACNYIFSDNRILKNYARGDWFRALKYYFQLKDDGPTTRFLIKVLNKIDSISRPIR